MAWVISIKDGSKAFLFKSFPVETDDYFYQVVRYAVRNALRANMVARAEDWPWSSLRRGERDDPTTPLLAAWPVARPANWLEIVNQSQTEGELEALRRSLQRGAPYGGTTYTDQIAKRLNLQPALRPLGRPKNET